MANPDTPKGFRAISPVYGGGVYAAVSTYATAIFKGDVIDAQTTGYVQAAAAQSTAIIGASEDYGAASTNREVFVYDNPAQKYSAQDDASGTPAQTHLFNNADHVAGAGSTTSKMSAHELAWSTIVNTTGGFTILECVANPENSIGDNAEWICMINEGLYHSGKTTV